MTLAQTLQSVLTPYTDRKRWVVALSGGLDSTVLLHALAAMESRPALCALHIHHGLQGQAEQWLQHCESLCGDLDILFSALRVTVNAGAGPEAAAREARYQAFSGFLQTGDVLMQGHHLDDQVETLFLRLLRGTGIDGMQGIPPYRRLAEAELLRPLLSLPRSALEAYANANQLHWIEDPSNADERFDRNYLRQRVLPLIGERWPAYRDTVGRFSRLAGQANTVSQDHKGAISHSSESLYARLDLVLLRAMANADRNATIRHWLSQYELCPSEAQLEAIHAGLVFSSGDAEPLFELGSVQLRRFREQLYITKLADVDASFERCWDFGQPLLIPGAGCLRAEISEQGGLVVDKVVVRLRQGGERCRPAGRGHSQTLKKLLQEYEVPPWLRDRLPLLYTETGELAAVADLWICEGFTGPGGRHLHWQS
ncbi:MAG: tRNA(Ile)-lysidine synthase [Bermanella sp.]|jgi:tRNA(Ile)-lysidine synthase